MSQTIVPTSSLSVKKWKSYASYKDSGVEWLGNIPTHWQVKRLKYISPISKSKLTEKPDNLPYLGLEHIESKTGRLLLNTPIENVESTVSVFAKGDILFGKLRPYLAKVTLADFPGVCTTELLALQPTDIVNSKFLFYRLLSEDFIEQINSMTYGTKMPRASGEQIGNLAIQLPPVSEQCAIATFLDHHTTRINTLIAKKEQLVELLKEKRAALISQAVTKGLDPTVPMKDSGVEWLGEIPEHWEVKRTKFVAKQESGHTPSRQHPEYWVNCTIPWISLADVWQLREEQREYIEVTKERVSELGIANSSARLLPAGTVVVSRTASVGFSGIMSNSMATTQDFANWVCKPCISPEFLLYVFRSMKQEFRRLVMGSTHQTIYMPDIGRFTTPLPPRFEQDVIVDYIRKETARIDALISRIQDGIKKLKEYSTALISAAVTGKIDVRDVAEESLHGYLGEEP